MIINSHHAFKETALALDQGMFPLQAMKYFISLYISYNNSCNDYYNYIIRLELISLGQTINVCGSYPVYTSGIDVTIGNNC